MRLACKECPWQMTSKCPKHTTSFHQLYVGLHVYQAWRHPVLGFSYLQCFCLLLLLLCFHVSSQWGVLEKCVNIAVIRKNGNPLCDTPFPSFDTINITSPSTFTYMMCIPCSPSPLQFHHLCQMLHPNNSIDFRCFFGRNLGLANPKVLKVMKSNVVIRTSDKCPVQQSSSIALTSRLIGVLR